MPFRLSERTSNSKALSTICRFVFRRVNFFALRTRPSLMSILVLTNYAPFFHIFVRRQATVGRATVRDLNN